MENHTRVSSRSSVHELPPMEAKAFRNPAGNIPFLVKVWDKTSSEIFFSAFNFWEPREVQQRWCTP